MKISFDVERKYAYAVVGLLVLFGGVFAVNAFGGTNPAIMGHSVGEIDFTGGFNVPSGDVGIGVPVPTQKLDVNGNVKASGYSQANGGMRASKYCDLNGHNCRSATSTATHLTSTHLTPTITFSGCHVVRSPNDGRTSCGANEVVTSVLVDGTACGGECVWHSITCCKLSVK